MEDDTRADDTHIPEGWDTAEPTGIAAPADTGPEDTAAPGGGQLPPETEDTGNGGDVPAAEGNAR